MHGNADVWSGKAKVMNVFGGARRSISPAFQHGETACMEGFCPVQFASVPLFVGHAFVLLE